MNVIFCNNNVYIMSRVYPPTAENNEANQPVMGRVVESDDNDNVIMGKVVEENVKNVETSPKEQNYLEFEFDGSPVTEKSVY